MNHNQWGAFLLAILLVLLLASAGILTLTAIRNPRRQGAVQPVSEPAEPQHQPGSALAVVPAYEPEPASAYRVEVLHRPPARAPQALAVRTVPRTPITPVRKEITGR
jgi:hypothetical protein